MDIKEYLVMLIDKFRERLMELSDEERSAVSKEFCDFSVPCQSLVIWAKDPEFQIAVFSHIQSFEDKLVRVYGPIENNKLIDEIEERILNDELVEAIGRKHVEAALIPALQVVRNRFDPLVSLPERTFIPFETRISDSAFYGLL